MSPTPEQEATIYLDAQERQVWDALVAILVRLIWFTIVWLAGRKNPIHEGAHGIHGLDLLGRKVIMNGGAGLELLANTITQTIDRAASNPATAALADELRRRVERLVTVTMQVWSAGDVAVSLANATAYLEATGHIVIAWMWLEQLLAVADKTGDFYDGKRVAAQYFFTYELPKVDAQFDLLAALDRTTLDARPEIF